MSSQSSRPPKPATPSTPPPRTARLPLILGGGVGVLIVALLVVFALTRTNTLGTTAGTTPPATMASGSTTPAPAVAQIAGEIAVTFTDRGHTTEPLTYKEVPPMGGPHWSDWANCGIYDKPIQNEQGVHSLEHGAIWITYQPDLPTAQVETLRNIVRQTGYRLVSPYPGLPHSLVATAWGYQLPLDSPDDPRLMQFINLHQQNPAGPEPGASCSGGVGTPLP